MDIIGVLTGLVRGQNEDNEDSLEENTGTELTLYDKDLACEHQIIKCQLRNGRLLGSTAKALRIKYANEFQSYIHWRHSDQPSSDIVDRAIARLKQRRKRGNCSVKAEQEKYVKLLKPLVDMYFKKKDESFSNGTL